MENTLNWTLTSFEELSVFDLYDILRLRSDVFVVEQQCVYCDLDNKDQECLHLTGRLGDKDTLVAYTRIVPPGISYPEPSIGRVLTASAHRRHRFGKELMQKSIEIVEYLYPDQAIRIGAQTYLKAFYNTLGFTETGDPYEEDGIEHIEMIR